MPNEEKDAGKTLLEWEFAEYTQPQRSKAWYFWFLIIVVALLVYSLVTINFLFAVIIIIATIIILMRSKYEPLSINFAIAEGGVKVDGKFYAYELMKDFYLIYKPPEIKNLYLEFKSLTKPRLIIPLDNQNPLTIREILMKNLTEDLDKEEEPASEAWRKLLKF